MEKITKPAFAIIFAFFAFFAFATTTSVSKEIRQLYKSIGQFEKKYRGGWPLKVLSKSGWKKVTSPSGRKLRLSYRTYNINGNNRAAGFLEGKIDGKNLKFVIANNSLRSVKRSMKAQIKRMK